MVVIVIVSNVFMPNQFYARPQPSLHHIQVIPSHVRNGDGDDDGAVNHHQLKAVGDALKNGRDKGLDDDGDGLLVMGMGMDTPSPTKSKLSQKHHPRKRSDSGHGSLNSGDGDGKVRMTKAEGGSVPSAGDGDGDGHRDGDGGDGNVDGGESSDISKFGKGVDGKHDNGAAPGNEEMVENINDRDKNVGGDGDGDRDGDGGGDGDGSLRDGANLKVARLRHGASVPPRRPIAQEKQTYVHKPQQKYSFHHHRHHHHICLFHHCVNHNSTILAITNNSMKVSVHQDIHKERHCLAFHPN